MTKITSSTIPSWFDLERYADCDVFTLRDWHINLLIRTLFYNQTDYWLEHIGRYWETDFDKPILRRADINSDESIPPLIRENISSSAGFFTLSVNPIELYFPAWVMLDAPKSTPTTNRLVEAVDKLGDDTLDEELDKFLCQPIDDLDLGISLSTNKMDAPYAHVEIDLAVPDEMILNDMKKWLAAARKRYDMPEGKIFSAAEQRKWRSLQILAYMDLTIWAKVESVSIPYAVMGNALFPDQLNIDVVDRVRRVVKPKAENLLRFDTIEVMKRQTRYLA